MTHLHLDAADALPIACPRDVAIPSTGSARHKGLVGQTPRESPRVPHDVVIDVEVVVVAVANDRNVMVVSIRLASFRV